MHQEIQSKYTELGRDLGKDLSGFEYRAILNAYPEDEDIENQERIQYAVDGIVDTVKQRGTKEGEKYAGWSISVTENSMGTSEAREWVNNEAQTIDSEFRLYRKVQWHQSSLLVELQSSEIIVEHASSLEKWWKRSFVDGAVTSIST